MLGALGLLQSRAHQAPGLALRGSRPKLAPLGVGQDFLVPDDRWSKGIRMKTPHLLAMSEAMAALLIFAAAGAHAQSRPVSSGARITFPSHSNRFSWERGQRFRGGIGGVWIVEREVPVIVEREVVREVPAPPPAPSPKGEGKRKPYVIGSTYASLPGGCMKMIEGGASYYFCGGGEWYRQVGSGRSARYQAVARKL